MAHTIPGSKVIGYPPEAIDSFHAYAIEWIDNLHFIQPPGRFLANPTAHVEAARTAFLKTPWDGDGEIGLLWLPTFVFPIEQERPWDWTGIVIWHVKQVDDGISWLLSPIELPFDRWH